MCHYYDSNPPNITPHHEYPPLQTHSPPPPCPLPECPLPYNKYLNNYIPPSLS